MSCVQTAKQLAATSPRGAAAAQPAPRRRPARRCVRRARLARHTATSLGVHNISMDGRPIAQERAGLVADRRPRAVPCELAAEFGAHFGVKKGARLSPPRELQCYLTVNSKGGDGFRLGSGADVSLCPSAAASSPERPAPPS
jgi:hypothetical protein